MWLPEQLGTSVNRQGDQPKEQDVVLYGFGRIGRLLARILLERSSSPLGSGLNLRAVVVRKNGDKDLVKRASLLERDSVHGPFKGVIEVDEETAPSSLTAFRFASFTPPTRPLLITPSTALRMPCWWTTPAAGVMSRAWSST